MNFKFAAWSNYNKQILLIAEILLVLGGISIFACLVHREGSLFIAGIGGLVLASLAISYAISRSSSVFELFGLASLDKKVLVFTCAGLALGVVAATGYRLYSGLSLLPGTVTIIALISPMIGMTEELVFRGYLQGRCKRYGPYIAVFIAAAGHTLYKYLVLKSLAVDIVIDFPRLVLFTFLFGLVVGALREMSRSVLPALAAHAVFDILVYGDFTEMPVWVWG